MIPATPSRRRRIASPTRSPTEAERRTSILTPTDQSTPLAPPVCARPAATLALLRIGANGEPETLMGQRGGGASFMPSKVVFPGGALDPEDQLVAAALEPEAAADALDPRLWKEAAGDRDTGAPLADIPSGSRLGLSLSLTAMRETFEETGLALCRAQNRLSGREAEASWIAEAQTLGGDWRAFAERLATASARPAPEALGFFFRAITPPSLPRRFDAHFFVAFAGDLLGDVEDFSGASGELSSLAWTPLSKAAEYNLPFITHMVIAELQAIASLCADEAAPEDPDLGLAQVARLMRRRPVPFFRHRIDAENGEARPRFEAI